MTATFPFDPKEMLRLDALQRIGIAKLMDDPALRRITTFAAQHFRVPISLVTLVEADCVKIVSDHGLNAPRAPRNEVFCAYTILSPDVLVIPDMLRDARFSGNPLVTGKPRIRFYAGAPLIYESDVRLGSMCIMDMKPRSLSRGEQAELVILAEHVMSVIIARTLDLPEPDLSTALSL